MTGQLLSFIYLGTRRHIFALCRIKYREMYSWLPWAENCRIKYRAYRVRLFFHLSTLSCCPKRMDPNIMLEHAYQKLSSACVSNSPTLNPSVKPPARFAEVFAWHNKPPWPLRCHHHSGICPDCQAFFIPQSLHLLRSKVSFSC